MQFVTERKATAMSDYVPPCYENPCSARYPKYHDVDAVQDPGCVSGAKWTRDQPVRILLATELNEKQNDANHGWDGKEKGGTD